MSREDKNMREETTLLSNYTCDTTPTDMLPLDNLYPGATGSVR